MAFNFLNHFMSPIRSKKATQTNVHMLKKKNKKKNFFSFVWFFAAGGGCLLFKLCFALCFVSFADIPK